MAQGSEASRLEQSLVALDESIIVEALSNAQAKRPEQDDIVKALKARGFAIRVRYLEKPFWQSKKFWAGALALGILLLDSFFPTRELWKIAAGPLTYMFGQGLADLGKNRPSGG